MNNSEIIGGCGVVLSAIGAGLAVNEIQSIISIIVTVSGFVISILIPSIVKIINKIKEAKADGKITTDEAKDIAATVHNSIDTIKNGAEELVEKAKGENKDA